MPPQILTPENNNNNNNNNNNKILRPIPPWGSDLQWKELFDFMNPIHLSAYNFPDVTRPYNQACCPPNAYCVGK